MLIVSLAVPAIVLAPAAQARPTCHDAGQDVEQAGSASAPATICQSNGHTSIKTTPGAATEGARDKAGGFPYQRQKKI